MLMRKAVRSTSVQPYMQPILRTDCGHHRCTGVDRFAARKGWMDGYCATASAVEGGKRGPVLLLSRLVEPAHVPIQTHPTSLPPFNLPLELPAYRTPTLPFLPHGQLRWWWSGGTEQ